MKCIIYKTADDGVIIGRICKENGDTILSNEDVLKHAQQIVDGSENILSFRVADSSDLPSGDSAGKYDNYFLEAFTDKHDGEQIDVDMPRARGIQMDKIRVKRNAKFSDLDQEYMMCDEQEDAPGKSAIAAQKWILRDLPETFDLESITDPDVLKDTWPPEVL